MPPINRYINRPLYGQQPREEIDIPEANQQQEAMRSMGSSIPETNERNVLDQMTNLPGTEPVREESEGPGTVVSAAGSAFSTPMPSRIGAKEIQEARATLKLYKQGKASLENRIVSDELWWELRHWEDIESGKSADERAESADRPRPTSAWLFNSIVNKHADAMDNMPEPLILPREEGDKESAETLSSVIPVLMDYNDFEKTYSDAWWDKLVHGTAVYQVSWDSTLENGLGNVDVKAVDVLSIFWEPGITDIQKSRNLFACELIDTDLLDQQYPEHKDKMKGNDGVDIPKYLFQDDVDTSKKSLVVDWYYKKRDPSGRTILHYCKFCNDEVLYASENDEKYAEVGFYDHGLYPFVFDVMFPKKGSPAGFGYVTVCKDPQLYIDELSANLLHTSMMGSRKRYFMSASTNVNPDQFADWNQSIVKVEGELGDTRIMEIPVTPPAPIYTNLLQMKVEEMKETSSNRDVNAGSAGHGITAAASIAALQESGNKTSRDSLKRTYRAIANVYKLVLELVRQFYDTNRAFRITGDNDTDLSFVELNNSGLVDQPVGVSAVTGEELFRKPVFDIKVSAQKRNPFSTMEGNQRASELYGMGFFNPDRAQEAIAALEMMEFEGIESVRKTVAQGNTLQNIVIQQNQMIQQLASMLGLQTGAPAPAAPNGPAPAPTGRVRPSGVSANATAERPRTSYMNRLAARSTPNMDMASQAANPTGR